MRTTGIHYPEAGKIEFKDLGDPPPLSPTQILLATEFSGVTNGTERHALLGEHGWKGLFPSAHGYQMVGRVAAKGAEVKQFDEGDRIFCGQYVGHRGWHVIDVGSGDPGSFLSHLCIKLPEDLDPKECALFGVAGVALRGIRRFRTQPAANLWVGGQGLIGHFAAQAAKAVGADVTTSDVNPKRLELSAKYAAHRTIDAREESAMESIKQRAPYDVIIDACGLGSFAMDVWNNQLLGYKGVLGMLAVRGETTFHWSTLHTTEASIEVSCHFSVDELKILIHFLRQGLIHIKPLITHDTSVDNAVEVYSELRDDPSNMLGIVFDWS